MTTNLMNLTKKCKSKKKNNDECWRLRTRACSTWLGHIQRPEGSAVSGGLRQSKWYNSGQ